MGSANIEEVRMRRVKQNIICCGYYVVVLDTLDDPLTKTRCTRYTDSEECSLGFMPFLKIRQSSLTYKLFLTREV